MICSAWRSCGVERMTASTLGLASASSKFEAVSTPSAAADARAESRGSTPSTGLMTSLSRRFLRMFCPHQPRPMTAALIMCGFSIPDDDLFLFALDISGFGHLGAVPVADLAGGHQRDTVMSDDIVEQRFQIFDAMGNTGDVGVNRDRHDPRVGFALEIQPVELIGAALEKLLGRQVLQRMDDDVVGFHRIGHGRDGA